MSAAGTPTSDAPSLSVLDERDAEPRTPMRRLGSTRKLAAFSNIKLQLTEQTRVLEARAEAASGVAGELSDYCRRRADLEHEYSRALDKLARAALQRHKDHKHKREQWSLTGAYACWQAALENTRALSRDHAALAELYGGPLCARLQRAADDALRLHRKCRDIVSERHEELGAGLAEAAAAGKAHAAAAAEWRAAALKLRHAHDQRAKLAAAEPPRLKKLKAIDKELEKRRSRHSEARAKALRARADYALSLEAANAALQRYYLDDIADIMLCMEVGFEAVVGRAVRAASAAESARAHAAVAAAGALLAAADALDALQDRQRLVCAHAAAFAPPRPVPFRAAVALQDAEMRELLDGVAEEQDEATAAVTAELTQRLQQLEAGARQLRLECCESAKTLDAAEAELVRQMEGGDIDVSRLFGAGAASAPPAPPAPDDDAPRRDQEDYYLAKFRSYVTCAGRLARLESKAAGVRWRVLGAEAGGGGAGAGGGAPAPAPASPPRRHAARRGLFAAPLSPLALADTLPAVLTACVRVIATYGLRHQGIFRVSGSQVEMQALRAAFERGEDPLARVRDASDINSVCGLLKLYLRSLRPPLVPADVAERLLRAAGAGAGAELPARLRAALADLPRPNMLVLRYLTAFLAHLTEHSEHNMMDAWNLAICLGPTLMAARGEGGAQVTAQNLVNELVKRIIIHHEEIFPQDIAPYALYDKNSVMRANAAASASDEADGDGGGACKAEADAETEAEAEDETVGEEAEEHDVRDDLSMYADDDDDISSDGESGEWRDRDSTGHNRSQSVERPARARAPPAPPSAQVREASPASTSAASAAHCRRLAEATPDLVLDLPARAEPPLPAERADRVPPAPPERIDSDPHLSPASASASDSADTFAHNRDTLKKRTAHKHTSSDGGAEVRSERSDGTGAGAGAGAGGGGVESEAGAGAGAGGSPVPARNTARVAAKFAELTLTGGSLKPALAAKPALLRRPTPHPHHARSDRERFDPPDPDPDPHPDPASAC